VSTSHVADEAANTILALMEMQGWIVVTVSVILWPPALCAPVTDYQSKSRANPHHRHVFFYPRDIRPKGFL
jgi:hypothetical protein